MRRAAIFPPIRPTSSNATVETAMLSDSRIRPSPSASGRSPLLVSSAIAVVMVRVKPAILPPTTMMAPTSAMARPNAARKAVRIEARPSATTRPMVFHVDSPSMRARSAYSAHNSDAGRCTSATTIGVASTACAMIIAVGVNSRPAAPSGPARERSRNTPSPATTGGRPRKALVSTIIACRPRKRLTASQAPNGAPIKSAIRLAVRLTRSDNVTMFNNSGSPRTIIAKRTLWLG